MILQTLLLGILSFLNGTVVPFLLAIAFLVFIWNVFRYFIVGGENEESQGQARSLALWGIGAFVIIVSIWGIVNLLVSGFGFGRTGAITPDYMCDKAGGNCVGGGSNNSSGGFSGGVSGGAGTNTNAPVPVAPVTNDLYQSASPQEL